MSTSTGNTPSTADRAKIAWAGARYGFWLDLNSVPRKQRKALRTELESNLAEASANVGATAALSSLGSLRTLAAETTRDSRLRSRWLAGWVAALTTLAAVFVTFLILTLYYASGVLDTGVTEPVRSSLFPFFGSSVTVDPSNGGIALSVEPGPMPFVCAFAVWVLIAKPWRNFAGHTAADDAGSN